MFQFARPSIPLGLLHDIVAITPSETFSQAQRRSIHSRRETG